MFMQRLGRWRRRKLEGALTAATRADLRRQSILDAEFSLPRRKPAAAARTFMKQQRQTAIRDVLNQASVPARMSCGAGWRGGDFT